MTQLHGTNKVLSITIFSILAIGGVASTMAKWSMKKRQGIPLKVR